MDCSSKSGYHNNVVFYCVMCNPSQERSNIDVLQSREYKQKYKIQLIPYKFSEIYKYPESVKFHYKPDISPGNSLSIYKINCSFLL